MIAKVREWLWRRYFRVHVRSKKVSIGAWCTLSNEIGAGRNRLFSRELRLQQAYQAVFQGKPSQDDQQIVLVDLRRLSGYDRFHGPKATDQELRHQEGMRALFGQIHSYLTISDEDQRTLEEAARREQVINEENF